MRGREGAPLNTGHRFPYSSRGAPLRGVREARRSRRQWRKYLAERFQRGWLKIRAYGNRPVKFGIIKIRSIFACAVFFGSPTGFSCLGNLFGEPAPESRRNV